MPDLTIYHHFDDYELQKYHIDDMTIYVLIYLFFIFLNEKFTL